MSRQWMKGVRPCPMCCIDESDLIEDTQLTIEEKQKFKIAGNIIRHLNN